ISSLLFASLYFFFSMLRRSPRPTLFPYTTLFRSISQPVQLPTVSYERPPVDDESSYRTWRESQPREARRFSPPPPRSLKCRRECPPAFEQSTKGNRAPGASIESEHRAQAAMYVQQSLQPNAPRHPRQR